MKKLIILISIMVLNSMAGWGEVPVGWGDFQMGLVNNNRPEWDEPMKEAHNIEVGGERPYQLDRRYVYIDNLNDAVMSYWGKSKYATEGRNWSKDPFYVSKDVGPCIVIYMLQRGGDSWDALKTTIQDSTSGGTYVDGDALEGPFMKHYFLTIASIVDSSKGMNPIFVLEPDVWGYVLQHARENNSPLVDGGDGNFYKTDDFNELNDDHLDEFCHINDLGLPWLEEFDNKLSNLPGAIIKTIKHHDPDAFAGILMAFWAWKPGKGTSIGLFQDTQENIDIAAREEAKFVNKLLGSTPYRGDFLGMEKNGTDLGSWKEIGHVQGTYLDWDDDDNAQWLGLSKYIAEQADLPLLGWQISIGHEGLPNVKHQYEDTFYPYFFSHVQDFIDAGFIGLMGGCANQGKGTAATVNADITYFDIYQGQTVTLTGDGGWFYDQLKTFNENRPYDLGAVTAINEFDNISSAKTVSNIAMLKDHKLTIGNIPDKTANVKIMSLNGRVIKSLQMNKNSSIEMNNISSGIYLISVTAGNLKQELKASIYW